MNIVFMGTPDFSVPVLDALVNNGHNVVAVVTQTDKPKGRGKEVKFTPVKEAALKYNIPVLQPVKVRTEEFLDELRGYEPELIVVVAYGQILPKALLDMPKYGCVNVHASLLPRLRGAAPIQWAIIEGDDKTGVTTMMMDVGLDTGDMLEKEEVIIEANETGGTLHDKLSQAGARLIITTIEKIENGTIVRTKQDDSLSTYAKMLDKKLGDIDFTMDAKRIERLIRGLNPWPSAYTTYNGKLLKIWEATPIDKECDGDCGEIVEINKDTFLVKTGKGLLEIKVLQPEGKGRMKTADFLRGNKINIGERLGNKA